MIAQTNIALGKAKSRMQRHRHIKIPTVAEYLSGISKMILILSQSVVEHQTENSNKLGSLMEKVDKVLTDCCNKVLPSDVEKCAQQFKLDAQQLAEVKAEVKTTLAEVMSDKMRGFQAVRDLHSDVVKQIVKSFKEHIAQNQNYLGNIEEYKKSIREEIDKFTAMLALQRSSFQQEMTEPLLKAEHSATQLGTLVTSFGQILERLERVAPNIQLLNSVAGEIRSQADQLDQSVQSILSDRDSLVHGVQQKLESVLEEIQRVGSDSAGVIASALGEIQRVGSDSAGVIANALEEIQRVGSGSAGVIANAQQDFLVEASQVKDQMADAVSAVQSVMHEIKTQRSEVNQFSQQTANDIKQTSSVSQKIVDQQKQILTDQSTQHQLTTALKNQVGTVSQIIADQQTQLKADHNSQHSLAIALQNRIDTARQLQDRLETVQKRIEEKLDVIQRVDHPTVAKSNAVVVQQITELADKIQQLQQQIQTSSAAKDQLSINEANLQHFVSELYSKIGEAFEFDTHKQITLFKQAVSSINAEYAQQWHATANSFKQLVQDRQDQLSWLEQQIRVQTAQLSSSGQELEAIIANVNAQRKQFADALKKTENQQQMLNTAESTIQNLSQRATNTQHILAELESDVQNRKSKIAELDRDLAAKRDAVSDNIKNVDSQLDQKMLLMQQITDKASETRNQLAQTHNELLAAQQQLTQVTNDIVVNKQIANGYEQQWKSMKKELLVQQDTAEANRAKQAVEKEIFQLGLKKERIIDEINMAKKVQEINDTRKEQLRGLTKRVTKEDSKNTLKRPFTAVNNNPIQQQSLKSQYTPDSQLMQGVTANNNNWTDSSSSPVKVEFHPPQKTEHQSSTSRRHEERKAENYQISGRGAQNQDDDHPDDAELVRDLSLIIDDATDKKSGDINWWLIGLGVVGVGAVGGIVVHKWRKKKRQAYSLM